jgi:hypothetical protein
MTSVPCAAWDTWKTDIRACSDICTCPGLIPAMCGKVQPDD